MILKTSKILSTQRVSILLIGTILFLFSCNPTKTLKENEIFLKKNKITVDNSKIDKDELEE
ncbi:MAG TPA: hypothetical protein PK649_12480, partial [Vicingus sp.]|nr:hypothetical protein [Vicingus sp.]